MYVAAYYTKRLPVYALYVAICIGWLLARPSLFSNAHIGARLACSNTHSTRRHGLSTTLHRTRARARALFRIDSATALAMASRCGGGSVERTRVLIAHISSIFTVYMHTQTHILNNLLAFIYITRNVQSGNAIKIANTLDFDKSACV